MKTIKYFSIALVALLIGCSSDDTATTPINELDGLTLIQEIHNQGHTLELYNATGTLQQGYNPISLRIKDKDGYLTNTAPVSWMPVMHMAAMEHSCPYSPVVKAPGKESLYNGYIVFQMAENSTEYWTLDIHYTVNGVGYTASERISVPASTHKRVLSFTGTDGKRYVLAMAEPTQPKVAVNTMSAVLYTMSSMMEFTPVDGFSIATDPRMPSMGNHGSPNNTALVQAAPGGFYQGNLSLTMTGYWKINLVVANTAGQGIKGEPITDTVTESSIYFELEF